VLTQNLVKAVYYTVTHATTTDAAITSVTATVTLSDVPMELSAAAPITGESFLFTVTVVITELSSHHIVVNFANVRFLFYVYMACL